MYFCDFIFDIKFRKSITSRWFDKWNVISEMDAWSCTVIPTFLPFYFSILAFDSDVRYHLLPHIAFSAIFDAVPVRHFVHIQGSIFIVLLLAFKASLCLLDTNSSSDNCFEHIFY